MTANERFVRAQARVKPYPAGLPISFVYGGRKYRGLEEALFHPSTRRDEIDSRMTRTAITGRLADGLEVEGARLEHGLLHVDLIRPEAERQVRRIPITSGPITTG